MRCDNRQLMRAAQQVFADSLVSVVMPTWNQVEFLPTALQSVLTQTHGNLQVIVVDDGSTDGTREFLKTVRDPRVEVIRRRQNRGLPAALNTGFARIRGRYATWTSSDNVMRPHCVAALLRALRDHPEAGVAHGDYRYFGTHEGVGDTSGLSFEAMYYLGRALGPAFLLRSVVLTRLPDPPFDETLTGVEDTAFALELRRLVNFVHVPEILYDYRYHRRQLTAQILRGEGYDPLIRRMQARFDQRHRPDWQADEWIPPTGSLRALYAYPHCCHGGVEVVLLNRIRALQALGVHSEVCFGQDIGGAKMFAGVCPCHVLSQPHGRLAVAQLSKLVRDRRYDLVTVISYPLVYAALAEAEFQGAIVSECHGNLPLTAVPGVQTADVMIAVSRRLRRQCRRSGVRVPTKTITNTVPVEMFADGGASQAVVDGRFETAPAERVLAFAGRLGEEKNWPLILEAFAELAPQHPNLRLWFAGGGERQDRADALRRKVRELRLGPRFRWFPLVEPADMPKFYAAVARSRGVFVLPSREEAFGMVLAEAMAAGVPVVASNVGGIPELVDHGRTGLLITPRKASLRRAVQRLLTEPALYDRLAEQAREEVPRRFSLTERAPTIRALYDDLTDKPRRDTVVVISGVDWNDAGGGQRPRKLAEAFTALGHPAVFFGLTGETYGEFGDVRVYSLATLTGIRNPLAQEIAGDLRSRIHRWLALCLRRRRPVLVINCGFTRLAEVAMRAVKRLGARAVYDCIDNWAEFHRVARRKHVDLGYRPEIERDIVRTAHLVSASSRSLQRRMKRLTKPGQRVLYAPNALASELPRRPPGPLPPGFPDQGKTVGFVGSLWGEWVDLDLVEALARRRRRWQFVLVGPHGAILERRFHDLGNVHLFHEQPHSRLHGFLDHFGVGIIPFKLNRLTRAVSPIKVFDYLARGKPVVASPLPEVRGYPGVACASGIDEWLAALGRSDSLLGPREQLEEFLAANRWECRAEALWNAAFASPQVRGVQ